MDECKDIPNKDSFVAGRKLESFTNQELNQLNTFSWKDCVKWQWMNV